MICLRPFLSVGRFFVISDTGFCHSGSAEQFIVESLTQSGGLTHVLHGVMLGVCSSTGSAATYERHIRRKDDLTHRSDSDSCRQTAPTSRVLPVRLPPPALRLVIPLHYILYHSSCGCAAPPDPLWLILAVNVGALIQAAQKWAPGGTQNIRCKPPCNCTPW